MYVCKMVYGAGKYKTWAHEFSFDSSLSTQKNSVSRKPEYNRCTCTEPLFINIKFLMKAAVFPGNLKILSIQSTFILFCLQNEQTIISFFNNTLLILDVFCQFLSSCYGFSSNNTKNNSEFVLSDAMKYYDVWFNEGAMRKKRVWWFHLQTSI